MGPRRDPDRAGPGERRGPGRPARVDRAQVVDAAVDLVAAGGLDGLTMARAGRAVGLSEMGLYRHVANRDELVELVVDAALDRIVPDDVALPDRAGDVRAVLVDLGHRLAQGLPRYPGVAGHLARHGPRGPAGLRLMGVVLGLLARAGVPPELVALAHGHYTSTICSVAVFREHVLVPGHAAWGATAAERLDGVEWTADPALAGIAGRYTGDVDPYERYAIEHCVDAVLGDAEPPLRSTGSAT